MSGHAPGVLCRVKPPKSIPKWEYDQTNERIVELVCLSSTDGGLRGWKITPSLITRPPSGNQLFIINGVAETCLVPINPGDAPDETLTWAGLPNKVKEKV